MEIAQLLIAIPVFGLAYSALALWQESRSSEHGLFARRDRTFEKFRRSSAGIGARIGFNRRFLENAKFRTRLELTLLRSGNPFSWTAADMLFYKQLAVLIVGFLFWHNDVSHPVTWIAGLFAGFMSIDYYLRIKALARKADIQRHLPGFVDLLALAMESGLDLLAAVERILDKMKPNALRQELQTLIQENRLGTPRKEALKHLAFRTDLSDVQSLTSLIIQSEELGSSLSQVLRSYAEDMRNRRILRAEEVAGKAPVKLLFPMMVFFFPIIFIIIFGPLSLQLMGSFKQ